MWMGHYNHPTPKKTTLVSNSEQIAVLGKGKMSKSQKRTDFKTAVTYLDSKGRKRYKGTPQLRSTQNLWLIFKFVLGNADLGDWRYVH